jgi:hypothetical protein
VATGRQWRGDRTPCAPAGKTSLADFLDGSVARLSCLPGEAFSGQAFHRLAARVTEAELERVQVELARAAVARFELDTEVLAFDTTNFDTHIATTTPGKLARRGHAKSKRRDLRVVGLGVLVSETGHVPLLYRTYAGNGSDQGVLESCLDGLGKLHDALNEGEGTLVVVESEELLEGQKRGIAVALARAKAQLRALERRVEAGRVSRPYVERRVREILGREHLASFVVAEIEGTEKTYILALARRAHRRQLG